MPPAHIRVIACPNGGGFGGKSDPFSHEIVVVQALDEDGPAGEDHAHARGGLLLPPRPPPREDVGQDRPQEGRHASPPCTSAPRSTAAAYGSYGVASLYYTGALQTVTYTDPALQVRGRARLHQQAALRAQARPRHAAAALRARVPHRQVLPRPRARPGATGASRNTRRARAPSPRTRCRCGPSASRTCLERVIEQQRLRARSGAGWARAAASASPARPTSAAPACPSTGTRCRTRACRSRWTAAAAWPSSAAPPTSARARTRCSPTSWPRSWASAPEDIRVVTADTDLTPVDLGSYSSRVTLMTGNAAIQAARKRARADPRRGGAEARRARRAAARGATRRIWDAADPATALTLRRGGGAGGGGVRHAGRGRARTRRRGRSRSGRARASARRRPTRTRRRAVELSADRETGHHPRGQGLDRPRRGPVHQPAARDRPGRGLGLHGPGRGPDGGAGLPQGPAQDPLACSTTRARPRSRCRRWSRSWWRRSTPRGRTARRSAARARCCP